MPIPFHLCLWLTFSAIVAQAAAAGLSVQTDNATSIHHNLIRISGPLGLADVSVIAPQAQNVGILLTLRSGQVVPVDLRRVNTDQSTAWTGRLMAGLDAQDPSNNRITFSIKAEYPTDIRIFGPFTESTEPDGNLATPDWAKGLVWYQVFAERFRNGNPANDPLHPDTTLMPWDGSWDLILPTEIENAWALAGAGLAKPVGNLSGRSSALRRLIYSRRFGGDLQGVVAKLDHLQALGITGLYFCPIFESPSLHKYDATDFRHIDQALGHPGLQHNRFEHDPSETADPRTWKWTQADRYFLDVVLPEARSRGIRVILDGVWNHTGKRFWAFEHVLEHGRNSPFADWYYFNFDTDGRVTGWRAWDGQDGNLPKFRQTHNGDLIEPVKQHVFEITRRWMDPNGDGDPSDGIDGWRLDVAPEISLPFWKDWRTHVKTINPDALLVGELWFKADEYLRGDAFDAQMNYPLGTPIVRWARSDTGFGAEQLTEALTFALGQAPQTNLVQMNLLNSHDTERLASMIANPNRPYDNGAGLGMPADEYNRSRPDNDVYDLTVLAIAIANTLPGAPMIYYGDEWAMYGGDDPDCRKPLPWPDLAPPANGDEAADPAMPDRFGSWLRLRADPQIGPILRFGDLRFIPTSSPDLLCLERSLNSQRLRFTANRSAAAILVPGLSDETETSFPARSARLVFVPGQVRPETPSTAR